VALFFMHLKGASERLLKIVVASTIFFLLLLLVLSMADYGTRHWS
jgi:caa(3)-type oxidase subunit IV